MVILPTLTAPAADTLANVPAVKLPPLIVDPEFILSDVPAVTAWVCIAPPDDSATRPLATMLPTLSVVPAAAWTLPALIAPAVIDPPDATGVALNTSSGTKSSPSTSPPAPMNIE